MPVVDEVHLVRLAVAVVPLHRLSRQHDAEGDVRVVEERHAAGDPVARRLQVLRVDQPMPMRAAGLVGRLLERDVAHLLDGVRLGRRRVVIEEAGPSAESLDAEQLLGEQAAIGLAELGVTLVRHLAALEVEHRVHDRTEADTHEGAAPMVIDPSTEKGARVAARLRDEIVAWLVTVAPDGTPVPTPVWFWWDGETLLVYSQPEKPKLRNIAANPRVAVALRTDELGDDLVVITGEAAVDEAAPPALELPRYIEKYAAEIARLGSNPDEFSAGYSVPIRIRPTRLRA